MKGRLSQPSPANFSVSVASAGELSMASAYMMRKKAAARNVVLAAVNMARGPVVGFVVLLHLDGCLGDG